MKSGSAGLSDRRAVVFVSVFRAIALATPSQVFSSGRSSGSPYPSLCESLSHRRFAYGLTTAVDPQALKMIASIRAENGMRLVCDLRGGLEAARRIAGFYP